MKTCNAVVHLPSDFTCPTGCRVVFQSADLIANNVILKCCGS